MQRRLNSANWSIFVGLVLIAIAAGVFLRFAASSSGLVVVRNALLAETAVRSEFEWTPNRIPEDFRLYHGAVPDELNPAIVQILGAVTGADNFDKALAIAGHLRESRGDGEGIHADTVTAYLAIRNQHTGYCADFTQVFTGLAYGARVPVREWAISWRDWGKGHSFNEIFEPRLDKWILIDSFNSLYMVDAATHTPLSTLEVYDRLRRAGDPQIEVVPIVKRNYQFSSAQEALDYYREGVNELSLWWGNDVFSLDENPLPKFAGKISRLLEPIASVLMGERPPLKLLVNRRNSSDSKQLANVRLQFFLAVGAMSLGFFLAIAGLVMRKRSHDQAMRSRRQVGAL